MTNSQRFANFERWDRQIKRHPRNQKIFKGWLKALIQETNEGTHTWVGFNCITIVCII